MKKDMEELTKRHQKQRDAIQKQQQTNVDKLIFDSQKMSKKKNNLGSSGSSGSRHSSLGGRASDPSSSNISDMCNDHKVSLCKFKFNI
uniref:Uncharacterized protein n=1 Tax=Panagrolaimus sp. ES5 TaxID=591445 RepID=A0AC34GC37_9BILA